MDNYIVSARKYRPSTFDTVIGQRALTTTLKNAIASNKLAHAYLFCGPRGVGKTTCARIFAKTINCLSPTADGEACNKCESCMAFNEQRSYNIHELDAASNNSVDDIRSLIDQVRIPPQIGKYKVYIIDEVHMLSPSAFNAFLKTLEEPPHHAIFILATTEKHKILPTILSRCQIYDFSRISITDTVEHLQNVASKEGIDVEPEALTVIAQKADGGMRDALSIFDQVTSFSNGHITYKSVIENLNVLDYEYYFKLTDYILGNKISECMVLFNEVLKKGFDGNHFITGLSSHFRDLLVSKDQITVELLEVGASIRDRYIEQAKKCDQKFLYRAMKLCNDCDLNYRQSKNKRLLVELTLIQLSLAASGDDDMSGGRSPEKKLKPVFNQQQPVAAANTQTQTQPQLQQTNIQNSAVTAPATILQDQPGQYAQTAVHKSPLPSSQTANSKKAPVIKAGNFGVSIKRTAKGKVEEATDGQSQNTVAKHVEQEWEDYKIYDKDLNYYWREFASRLPHEQVANSNRMMNISPKLLEDGTTFEVLVDNEMAQKSLQSLANDIELYLRTQLHNRQVKMTLRISEANENVKAYSHVERFMMMSKKNPELLRLKEELGLELS